MAPPKPRSKASQRVALNRTTIAQAALDLIDMSGTDGLTMRALGQRLGVEAMAFYHHFPSRDSLLDAVVGIIESRYQLAGPEAGDWRARLKIFYESQLSQALLHPNAVVLTTTRGAADPATITAVDWIIGLLRAEGLGPRAAINWMRVFVAFSNGAAAMLAAIGDEPSTILKFDEAAYPNIAAARGGGVPPVREGLTAGLDAIFDAIAGEIAAATAKG